MATKGQLRKLKGALKGIQPLLRDSRKRDLNETDTANLVERFIEKVLGYDLFSEVSAEESVGSRAADYAIKLKGKPVLIVEVKRIQAKLKDNHVYQVKNYAANLGVPWCLLTNGVIYRLYRITLAESLKHDLAFEANVVDDDLDATAGKLSFLTRKGIAKKDLDTFWRRKKCLSEESILRAVVSLRVLRAIRREIRRESGQGINEVDIARAVKRMLAEELYSQYEELTAKVQRQGRKRARKRIEAAKKAVATRKAQAVAGSARLASTPLPGAGGGPRE